MLVTEEILQRLQSCLEPSIAAFPKGITGFASNGARTLCFDEWVFVIPQCDIDFRDANQSKQNWETTMEDPLTDVASQSTNCRPSLIRISLGQKFVAWGVQSGEWTSVASLLNQWGPPPKTIQVDWHNQISLTGIDSPNTCLTFCNLDGLLYLLPKNGIPTEENEVKFGAAWKTTNWPWQSNAPLVRPRTEEKVDPSNSTFVSNTNSRTLGDQNVSRPVAVRSSLQPKVKNDSKKPTASNLARKKMVIGLSVAILSATICFFVVWPFRSSERLANKNSVQAEQKNEPIAKPNPPVASVTPDLSDEPLIVMDEDDRESPTTTNDTLPSLDSLFSNLESRMESSLEFNELNSNSIVTRTLPSANMEDAPTHQSDDEKGIGDANEPSDGEPKPDSKDHENLDNSGITGDIEKRFPIEIASRKEKFSIGRPVVPKDAEWIAKLVMPESHQKSLILSPSEELNAKGQSKLSWKVGIEDEEPEVLIEMSLKPGRRWELLLQVGYRESSSAVAKLLGPDDAKNVVNQLIVSKSFVAKLLERNQIARDSGVRGPVDLFEQRRQLQRQEKDLEKAIEEWKVIEKLSNALFGQSHITTIIKGSVD